MLDLVRSGLRLRDRLLLFVFPLRRCESVGSAVHHRTTVRRGLLRRWRLLQHRLRGRSRDRLPDMQLRRGHLRQRARVARLPPARRRLRRPRVVHRHRPHLSSRPGAPARHDLPPVGRLLRPAEVCDGFVIPCPADLRAPPTKICRLAAGPCDLDETCDGTSATCPPDVLADAGLVCRPAFGACDAEEACTGSSATCPVNRPAPDGTVCIKGGTCEAGDCKPPIPTVKDAGPTMPAVDAGPDPIPTPPRGCGCTSTHGAFALALLVFVRRRRPVQSRPE